MVGVNGASEGVSLPIGLFAPLLVPAIAAAVVRFSGANGGNRGASPISVVQSQEGPAHGEAGANQVRRIDTAGNIGNPDRCWISAVRDRDGRR